MQNSLYQNKITSNGAIILFDSLRSMNSRIDDISLGFNTHIDDKCMDSVGEYIKNSKTIETIYLNNTNISDKGLEILASYIDDNIVLRRINFFGNERITETSIPLITKMIELSCIESFIVNGTSITQKRIFDMPIIRNQIKNGAKIIDLQVK